MKKILLLIITIAASLSLTAQDGTTLHFMRLNPYSKYSNPSTFLQYNGHIGIPAISNINMALTNSSLQYKVIFGEDNNGSITTLKLNDLADHLSEKNNFLNTSFAINIIDFGFRVKRMHFDFSYRIRSEEYLSFNRDFIALPVHGNMYYANQNKTATPELKLSLNAFQEFSFGIQAEITPQIYIGVRPKLLFGLAHAKTQNFKASLYTDPDDYSLSLSYNIDADLSCAIPYSIDKDSSGKTAFNFSPDEFPSQWQNAFKNAGAAIDLGFTYRINNMFGISASVLDLGFICWKTNNYHIQGQVSESGPYYDDGSFIFDGLTTDDFQDDDDSQNILNTILEYFPVNFEQPKMTHMLAGRFLVEGYCNVGKYHRFSALFQGRIVNKQFLPSFTVAWNGTFLNYFDLCVNYTIAKRSYGNIGLGIGLNLAVFHIYVATDNILAICTSKSPQRSLLNARNANIQFGFVFDWGKVKETKIEKTSKRKHND